MKFKKTFKPQKIVKGELLAILGQYRRLFKCSSEELLLLKFVENRLRSSEFDGIHFIQHGDLSVENILVSNNNFRIYDWELTGSERVPHHDFFVLLTTGLYSVEQCFDKNRDKGFRSIFFKKQNWNLFCEATKNYFIGLNININHFQIYFPFYLFSLPVILKMRGSSLKTIAMARENCNIYSTNYKDLDWLITNQLFKEKKDGN